jgi:16S rRNA A1518/A1519 N6-dimethyltransferase RsmA/KsgA/DIM1 with predicted DNA glycosylase/AP lyase activity
MISAPSVRLPEEILQRVELITRRVFSQRRKMLSNSLAPFLEKMPKDAEPLPLDLTRRCDSLTPQEYVMLAEKLF